jgi:3-oxoacyl-[acyl-carrier-protein] synthase-3
LANRKNSSHRYAHIVGWGKAVPDRVLTNNELSTLVDTSDEWIRQRTGIVERRIVREGESTFTLARGAAQAALDVADLDPAHIDLIIVATITPEHFIPATACLVQDALGADKAAAFDLSAGCSGFVYGMSLAADLLISGTYDQALVVGAETLSRIIDWTDRSTCVLFGDGAGAVVLQATETPGGILSSVLGSDGSGGDLLIQPAGGSAHPPSAETLANRLHYVQMEGREVFRFASRIMPEASREVLEKAHLSIEDVALFVPHQANNRILQASARGLGVPEDRMFTNLSRYGNTSAASVPIALCEAIDEGRIKRDDLIVAVGFGAGLTWAAAAIRWSLPLPLAAPARRIAFWRSLRYRLAQARSRWRRTWRRVDAWLFRSYSDRSRGSKMGSEDE